MLLRWPEVPEIVFWCFLISSLNYSTATWLFYSGLAGCQLPVARPLLGHLVLCWFPNTWPSCDDHAGACYRRWGRTTLHSLMSFCHSWIEATIHWPSSARGHCLFEQFASIRNATGCCCCCCCFVKLAIGNLDHQRSRLWPAITDHHSRSPAPPALSLFALYLSNQLTDLWTFYV